MDVSCLHARRKTEGLSWERVVEQLERLFLEVVAERDYQYMTARNIEQARAPTAAEL
ncbi:MAG: hypothetical protein M3P99_00275 [Pseudomonadota bacterium]|nr:hypothetical protein [Pseudomonadota bacterium]